MTGVAEPPGFVKPILLNVGIHKKGGNANDSIRNYFDIHWILALLISFGGLIIAVLTFLDKRNKRK